MTKCIFSGQFPVSTTETYIPDDAEKVAHRASFPGRPAYDVEVVLAGPEKYIWSGPEPEQNPRFKPENATIVAKTFNGYRSQCTFHAKLTPAEEKGSKRINA